MDAQEDIPEETGEEGAWGNELDTGALDMSAAMADGAWGDDLDLGMEGMELPAEEPVDTRAAATISMGDSCQTKWLRSRKLPADLVAAGEFEEALQLLKRRLGVVNVDPLEPLFQEAYWATCAALPGLPQAPSVLTPLLAGGNAKGRNP